MKIKQLKMILALQNKELCRLGFLRRFYNHLLFFVMRSISDENIYLCMKTVFLIRYYVYYIRYFYAFVF